MTKGAVSFTYIRGRRSGTAVNVDAVRNNFDMRRVYAISVRALMVAFFVGRNWTDKVLVGDSMCFGHRVSLETEPESELPVTVFIARGGPQPTGVGFIHLLPKTLNLVSWFSSHGKGILA